MLSKLYTGDEEKIFCISNKKSPSLMRIKALLKAYGLNKSFISFYTNEDLSSAICLQDSFAVFFLADETSRDKRAELAEFLPMIATSILGDIELEMFGFNAESGLVLTLNNYESTHIDDVSNSISDAFDILSVTFGSYINAKSYQRWYTDLSHRIRHSMSNVYTIKDVCTATSFFCENGCMMITQLATMLKMRQMGYAKRLISHIATTQKADEILVLSQTKDSDSFYINIGFEQVSKWYSYEK